MAQESYDIAIVGAGIIGLAHALAAVRLGLRAIVIDRDAQANGASIRNFGFVTVTGQAAGEAWRRARRSRDIWAEVAPAAGIAIEQRGLAMVAQRPEARAVCEAFLETDMAEGCRWLDGGSAEAILPNMRPVRLEGVLTSDIDLRVESRTAIPKLATWLAERHRVDFRRGIAVSGVDAGRIDTTEGPVHARHIVVCPGDDLASLFPDVIAHGGITRCKLQMLRLASPGYRLSSTIMSDLGLVRYLGYAALPEAAALRRRLQAEQHACLANGIHLIVAQSADGSLVVGDSHHYADTPDPFFSGEVEQLILGEFRAVFGAVPPVVERWTGTYASAGEPVFVATPMTGVRLVMVTSGTGASTGFGLAEDVLAELVEETAGELA